MPFDDNPAFRAVAHRHQRMIAFNVVRKSRLASFRGKGACVDLGPTSFSSYAAAISHVSMPTQLSLMTLASAYWDTFAKIDVAKSSR